MRLLAISQASFNETDGVDRAFALGLAEGDDHRRGAVVALPFPEHLTDLVGADALSGEECPSLVEHDLLGVGRGRGRWHSRLTRRRRSVSF
jgi:hypothetical protein